MSTDTSVPQPRVSGLDVSDSALLATLLREAPIGFASFCPDLRVRRINQTLARLDALDPEAHPRLRPGGGRAGWPPGGGRLYRPASPPASRRSRQTSRWARPGRSRPSQPAL